MVVMPTLAPSRQTEEPVVPAVVAQSKRPRPHTVQYGVERRNRLGDNEHADWSTPQETRQCTPPATADKTSQHGGNRQTKENPRLIPARSAKNGAVLQQIGCVVEYIQILVPYNPNNMRVKEPSDAPAETFAMEIGECMSPSWSAHW